MAQHLTEIKKCVSFVYIQTEQGLTPNGTGFFIGVKNEQNPDLFNVYFVTAKHVLQDSTGNYLSLIFLRVNTMDGLSQLIPVNTSDIKIFEHQDKDVDIALFPCLPDQNIFDYKFFPDDLIATGEIIRTHGIGEGDEVFFSGLFTSHAGQKRNQPIIRFGKIALVPEEKIEWKEANKPVKFMDLILLECQSFGGNSGAPVFFGLNPLRNPGQIVMGGANLFFGGIMTGSYLHANNVQMTQVGIGNLLSMENVGISAITPASKLHEMLFSDELIKQRGAMT